jgi:hypothetical protein
MCICGPCNLQSTVLLNGKAFAVLLDSSEPHASAQVCIWFVSRRQCGSSGLSTTLLLLLPRGQCPLGLMD